MKNSAHALMIYAQDYDHHLPDGLPRGDTGCGAPPLGGGWCNGTEAGKTFCTSVSRCGWTYSLSEYIKNNQVLLCPNWNKVTLSQANESGGLPNFWPTTYVLSEPLVDAKEKEIVNNANKVMLYEAVPYHDNRTIYAKCGDSEDMHRLDCNGTKRGMLLIVAFADGHTKVVNMNNAMGPDLNKLCTRKGISRDKWNLNSGWDPAHPTACDDKHNPSPGGKSGRGGANF